MVNARRGEIEAIFDGKAHRLVLTLGALAELEQAFGDTDMLALTARFENGRLSSRDCIRILGAGLRGGGADISDADVSKMTAEGGVAGFVDVVAKLLNATFAGEGQVQTEDARIPPGGAKNTVPFAQTNANPSPGRT